MRRFNERDHRNSLARPGRLTAALDYYRANVDIVLPHYWPPVTVPVTGVWSSDDMATWEGQMIGSQRFVTASWRYA